MRKAGDGTAYDERPPSALQHCVLHLRPRNRHAASAVIEGPFEGAAGALETAARLRETAAAGDQVEVLTGGGAWPTGGPQERAARAEELARRLLRRIRTYPSDFDPRASGALKPPGTLFALACMEAPRAARRLAATLESTLRHGRKATPGLVGQILLDVPHETAFVLHAIRWPARWFAEGSGRYASRPADAATACAVLARRLRRNRWPGPRTTLSHRIPEELDEAP